MQPLRQVEFGNSIVELFKFACLGAAGYWALSAAVASFLTLEGHYKGRVINLVFGSLFLEFKRGP